jgi:hypothetical protein
MANFFGSRPELRLHFLSVCLSVSLLLTACSTVGSSLRITPAAPAFTSTPGTAATQDSTYTYEIATTPAASGVTLALSTAPSGAALNGTTLTWTPTGAQSRVPDQFSVTATNAGGSATQSWSVTPSGTINGTWVDTNWTPSGPVLVPFDFTKVSIPPSALVSQPDGSFRTIAGTGNSDGTFSISNIPGGYYWLQPELRASYWTSSSTFDFGADLNLQEPKTTTSLNTTTLQLDYSGLDPLQAQDALWFVPVPPVVFDGLSGLLLPVGATTLNAAATINSNVDFSQINTAFMLQYEPVTIGALNILALGSEATLSNLALTNGTVNTISGILAHSPQVSFDFNVKGSAWVPLFENVGPGPSTPFESNLSVTAQPFVNGANLFASSGMGVSLLGPPPIPIGLSTSDCLFTGPTGSNGFLAGQPGEPPVVTDQDFGLVQYGDPFPTPWPRVFTFCQIASVNVPLPDSSLVTFDLDDKQSTPLPTSQIVPLISQVQNPLTNGSSLFAANTVGATGVTLSWTAPVGATPTGYEIATYVAGTLPNNVVTYVPGMTFYTAKTSATLPLLQAGKTYVFLISSILDGQANFETSPNRSALPTASVSVVSAPITISAGP